MKKSYEEKLTTETAVNLGAEVKLAKMVIMQLHSELCTTLGKSKNVSKHTRQVYKLIAEIQDELDAIIARNEPHLNFNAYDSVFACFGDFIDGQHEHATEFASKAIEAYTTKETPA